MKRIISVWVFWLLLLFPLWTKTDWQEEDHYSTLHEKALENLETLPVEKGKLYLQMLEEYPDVIMAFFLAYEESSKLLLANPEDIISHHQKVQDLWEEFKDDYSLPFFLSYIAKITVTEERITPYRQLFESYGLYDLKEKYPNKDDLVIELNLWTRQYMTFKPTSGRDMAPFDIMKRSNLGRCEEMQIFFISAARTVGIPARPAMTPLWAHTDNNHAWVEVFIDGNWSYLGAVEPAYEIDYAWFSASAARAIMIMASAAFPDSSDIVLREDRYSSLVNSTPNYDSEYIKSRSIEISTLDENRDPVPNAKIAVMVYNWGMLRPIHTSKTDDSGHLHLVTGKGSFFIAASKDSLFALYEVPAEQSDYAAKIILKELEPITQRAKMGYPDPKLPPREDRPEWNDYRHGFEEQYQQIVAVYQDREFPYEDADSLLLDVWSRCRNNKENFLLFYANNQPFPREFVSLLMKIDEKFLWQVNEQQWNNLYDSYQEIKPLDLSEDLQVNLLSPTVMFEEIPHNKIPWYLLQWRKGDIEERIFKMLEFIDTQYEIDSDKGVQSLLPYDLALTLPVLTPYQHKMLVCSVLRVNHIPASYTRIPDIISIYHLNTWRYYNLKEKMFIYQEGSSDDEKLAKLIIRAVDLNNYPLPINDEQCTITFIQDGLFYPYERQPEVSQDGYLNVELETGTYQIQIGYRVSDNLTRFYLISIEIEQGFDQEKTIILEQYPQRWEKVSDEITDLLTRLEKTAENSEESYYLILGDFDREPIRRTADRLSQQTSGLEIVWLGTKQVSDTPGYYLISIEYESWLADYPIMREKVLTLFYNEKDKRWSFYDGFWDILPE